MYLPYCAGVDECKGTQLYVVNFLHSRPFKEAITAVTLAHQTCRLLITSPVYIVPSYCSFLVNLAIIVL